MNFLNKLKTAGSATATFVRKQPEVLGMAATGALLAGAVYVAVGATNALTVLSAGAAIGSVVGGIAGAAVGGVGLVGSFGGLGFAAPFVTAAGAAAGSVVGHSVASVLISTGIISVGTPALSFVLLASAAAVFLVSTVSYVKERQKDKAIASVVDALS